jgi:hypothetical protein
VTFYGSKSVGKLVNIHEEHYFCGTETAQEAVYNKGRQTLGDFLVISENFESLRILCCNRLQTSFDSWWHHKEEKQDSASP